MPTSKSSAKFSINLQMPGGLPEKVTVAKGATVGDLVEQRNLEGYIISLNGSEASKSSKLGKGDVVRIGIKTKNA